MRKGSAKYFIIASIFALALFAYYSWTPGSPKLFGTIKGVNLEAPPRPFSSDKLAPIKDIEANWISLIPYGFSYKGKPNVHFDGSRQWWGERSDGIIEMIKYAKEFDLKIMLKPHVWVIGQGWAGDYTLENDSIWQIWEKDYAKYILNYAKIAQEYKVELLCIGTEYRISASQRPDYWRQLIGEIKEIYDGKLTYAANWDNFANITFWDDLDFIGIDAYYPLSDEKEPSLEVLEKGWQEPFKEIEAMHTQWRKPIIFTEYGYRSIEYPCMGHWKLKTDTIQANMIGQKNAYEALYQVFWDKEWFHGGFLWKWHVHHERAGGAQNKRFTPQNKPASEVIKKWYKLNQ
ncbi:hypothetical protein QQ008_01955 [Fulvivirgaceae bacterium BMA10]|uniref:Glycoside hydrolase n=1 Tax=Splendidivirga corallicola TaxID=3051826 RepID=A0ABT8KHA4_9BACT|nr:hypothetical protein [Fulvivirgaceae bacterium BMA10]